jgi:hypothetical protein
MAPAAMRHDLHERNRRTLFVLLGVMAVLVAISLAVVFTRH